MRGWLIVAALGLGACDDGAAAMAPDVGGDAVAHEDAAPGDAAPEDAGPQDATLDEGAPVDAELDAEPPPPQVIPLAVEARLVPGESVTLPVPAVDAAALELWVAATLWRVEDGYLTLDLGDGAVPVRLAGDARGGPAVVSARDAPFDGTGPGARPVALAFAPPAEITLTAEGGVLAVHGAWLVTPGARPPEAEVLAPAPRPALVVAPCAEPDCDDGAALSAALAEAPEGPVEVRLSGAYHLRTAVAVRRPGVRLVGPATLNWAPTEEAPVAVIDVRGAGPVGEAYPVGAAVAAEALRLTVPAPADWAPTHVRLEADDFGEVPASCRDGRDVERFHRHHGRLFAVRSVAPTEGGVIVELDRPVHLDMPAEANPRLRAVTLLPGFEAHDLHLLGACPEALDYEGTVLAPCANEALNTDDGVALRWALEPRVVGTHTQALGKYAIGVYDTLGARLTGNRMDHPTSYGGGGRGYGTHLIRSTRSLVEGAEVTRARHAVVIDFGSTEAQVLGGHFTDLTLATIDVHGESSRDTLLRDNTCADASTGIIVGGGGNEVHCNDGPRHHLEANHLETAIALWVADETGEVYARGNAMLDGRTAVTLINRAGPVWMSDGLIAGTSGPPLLVGTSGPLHVARTVFADRCDAAVAAVAAEGAVDWGEGNLFCPAP